MESYGKLLMKTPVKVIVVLLYFALIGVGMYGSTKVTVGLDPKVAGAPGSHFVNYLDAIETNFPSSRWMVSVVLQEKVDYSIPQTQKQFTKLDNIVKKSKYFKNLTYNCITAFLSWAEHFNKSHTGTNFYPNLRTFLTENRQYLPDLRFSTSYSDFLRKGNGSLIATKVSIFPKDNHLWSFQKGAIKYIRNQLKAIKKQTGYGFIPVNFSWVFIELLDVIGRDTAINLGICSAIVLLITLPYVINPIIALLMLIMFGSITVLLFALMAAWDIELNGMPSTIIIMSVGFCVDYMAHITHTYVFAEQITPEERMIYSLKTIGMSVTKGGMLSFNYNIFYWSHSIIM